MTVIAPIVEGQGEELALRVLVQCLLGERFAGAPHVAVDRPHRVPRGRMLKPEHLGRVVELHQRRVCQEGAGGVLVLLDLDDDDLADVRERVHAAGGRGDLQVVVAVKEFEAWFLADVESLRAHRSVRVTAESHPNPEGVRGAKEALSDRMLVPYKETLHQPAFCSLIDLDLVERRCQSFGAFVQAISRIVSPA